MLLVADVLTFPAMSPAADQDLPQLLPLKFPTAIDLQARVM